MNTQRHTSLRAFATVFDTTKRLLALLTSMALLFILLPAFVWAQDRCVLYSDYNSESYMRFPSSNFVSGEFLLYHDSVCQGEPAAGLSTGPTGYVHAPSQRAAASLCSDIHNHDMMAFRDFTKYSSQVIWWCLDPDEVPPSRGGNPTGVGPGADADVDSSAPGDHSCQTLVETTNLKMSATYGLASGIQCRRIGAAGVGNPTVTSRGVLDAVDIYGYAEQGYQLCFPQAGAIVFLDAATSPRSVVKIDFSHSGGFTCASLDRAGTVVLVGGSASTPSQTQSATTQYVPPGSYESTQSAISLINCAVAPSTTLRLRAAPWGYIVGRVGEASIVQATERTRSWYKIDYKGQDGWIAAWLTEAEGGCFGAGPGHAALPLIALSGSHAAHLTGA